MRNGVQGGVQVLVQPPGLVAGSGEVAVPVERGQQHQRNRRRNRSQQLLLGCAERVDPVGDGSQCTEWLTGDDQRGGDRRPRRRGAATLFRRRPDPALPPAADRKSTRLNSVTNTHLVCRLLLDKKQNNTEQ